ncbi:hypothetical protein CGMCC3_g3605 [Colletotrichum fructicola]|nr:uncharacterized protein CGMCC3_g3605 [Colletotrichum fructicola]KAE9580495.1 hypothetical protein CGMCC3_g3605 [Colletotrichum fructicola]
MDARENNGAVTVTTGAAIGWLELAEKSGSEKVEVGYGLIKLWGRSVRVGDQRGLRMRDAAPGDALQKVAGGDSG